MSCHYPHQRSTAVNMRLNTRGEIGLVARKETCRSPDIPRRGGPAQMDLGEEPCAALLAIRATEHAG